MKGSDEVSEGRSFLPPLLLFKGMMYLVSTFRYVGSVMAVCRKVLFQVVFFSS